MILMYFLPINLWVVNKRLFHHFNLVTMNINRLFGYLCFYWDYWQVWALMPVPSCLALKLQWLLNVNNGNNPQFLTHALVDANMEIDGWSKW